MVSDDLKKAIFTFFGMHNDELGILDFGYVLEYDEEIANRILPHYLPLANGQPEEVKRQCLDIMRRSCDENADHSHLPDWQNALKNIAIFCLLPTDSYREIEGILPAPRDLTTEAISAVIRFSRWYHTDSNFWKRFNPDAVQIGKLLWGDMEVLNKYNP